MVGAHALEFIGKGVVVGIVEPHGARHLLFLAPFPKIAGYYSRVSDEEHERDKGASVER
jgi:hypothetical protein